MPNWTKEQQLAISKFGTNIIVSAGAGSGKTAVLTERVIQKLKKGEQVNQLLILTFTNAAALEMKERIRKAIKENNLKDQLEKIDTSYITTFDSFALSIVKKYHYLLGINQEVSIADSLILKWQKKDLLENILNQYYLKQDSDFLTLIKDFTIKNDDLIMQSILEIYDKLDLIYDKETYFNNYFNTYYEKSYLNLKTQEYLAILLNKINLIKENLKSIELIADGNFYNLIYDSLKNLLESQTYDTIKANLEINLPRLKKGLEDIKPYKEKISKLINELKKLTIYDNLEEINQSLLETKKYTKVILEIIKKLDYQFNEFKIKNNLYDFLDIAKLAIKVLKENKEVQLELKKYFTEILVDEYQDTSDLQELFISLISNNNTYMVGDIKQSIYRFRNANPNLFKEKYSNYEKNIGGFKIDLVKNFRSREETLNNINYIFNYIMDLEIGGADYQKSHQMVFGNLAYQENTVKNQDNNFEILNYIIENKEFKKDEIEAFITLKDIKEKVENKYQVYDKEQKKLRDITYADFVILIDKSTSFILYKKIFEYGQVPLTILKDENIADSYDLYIIKNILILLKKVSEKNYDKEFKYAYLSISRSYLFNIDDNTNYLNITNLNKETEIIKKINNIIPILKISPIDEIIEKIIKEFNFYEKLITVGNIEEAIIRLDYITSLACNLTNLGYTYLDFINYLNRMITDKEEIKYSLNKENDNSVKIMTIHKSKGLEYHICYYTGLTNKFNVMDMKKKFIFDNKLGIITPYIKEGIKPTILKTLYTNDYLKEDISERIRLFYVALTRAKEKMILITTLKEEDEEIEDIVSLDKRIKYNSFASILNSISDKLTNYIKNINLKDYNLTKNYNLYQENNIFDNILKTKDKIEVVELIKQKEILEDGNYSKKNNELMTKDLKEKLAFGEHLHYILEIIDLKKQDLSKIDLKYHPYLLKFLNSDLVKNLEKARIYKEYEFIYQDKNIKKHGIIDLIVEYDDYINIIDYKLKNIDDLAYHQQLKGYKEYLQTKTNKPINLYLYSIITGSYKKIVD